MIVSMLSKCPNTETTRRVAWLMRELAIFSSDAPKASRSAIAVSLVHAVGQSDVSFVSATFNQIE